MFRRLIPRLFPDQSKQPTPADPMFVPVRNAQGRVTGLMDQRTAAYFESNAPNPSQSTLDALMMQVTLVRVYDGGMSGGKAVPSPLVLECDDLPSLKELRACLEITEDPTTFGHCMCLGSPTIECYSGQDLVAAIGIHHGVSIRWEAWKHDAHLRDGSALLDWFNARGFSDPLKAFQEDQRKADKNRRILESWYAVTPECLQPFWPQMKQGNVDLEQLRSALSAAYPDEISRAAVLFAWFGSGTGLWNGFPSFESVPGRLLLDYPTDTLVKAVSQPSVTPAELEGATRYFAGWDFKKQKPGDLRRLPQDLKRRLLAHSLMSSDEDKVGRARQAFTEYKTSPGQKRKKFLKDV